MTLKGRFILVPRLAIIIVVLLSFGSVQAARRLTICERIYNRVARMPANAKTAKKISIIIDLLSKAPSPRSREKLLEEEFDFLPYFHLLTKVDLKRNTVHGADFEEVPFIIEKPSPDSPTVWKILTKVQRFMLLEYLEAIYKSSTYDESVADDSDSIDQTNPLGSMVFEFLGEELPFFGISPRIFLKSARDGSVSGVCRHANCSFAANLIELGVPESNLRHVTGKRRKRDRDYHIITEVNFDGNWVAYDATAMSKNLEKIDTHLVLSHFRYSESEAIKRKVGVERLETVDFFKDSTNEWKTSWEKAIRAQKEINSQQERAANLDASDGISISEFKRIIDTD